MKKRSPATRKRFQAQVAGLLDLPADADDRVVHIALNAKGREYVQWYATRVGAISEFNATKPFPSKSMPVPAPASSRPAGPPLPKK